MATEITWHGHGTVSIKTGGKHLLIDPFFDDCPTTDMSANDVDTDYILISHGHFDHVADATSIAKRTGATIISNFEICSWFQETQGIAEDKVHAQHIGGGFNYDFGRVKLTLALHGSKLPDGSNGGNPVGFLLYLEDKKIYIAADTGLFGDMKLIGEEGIDLATLPLGDNFTMGPDDALRAVRLIAPKVVIPVHYDTWPVIEQDSSAWATRVKESMEGKTEPVLLKPGESYSL